MCPIDENSNEEALGLQKPGNAAAIREALELCVKYMCKYCRSEAKASGLDVPCVNGCETLNIAQAALALPRRNCDVGTADEQYARWRSFCDSQKCCNNQCPVYKLADVCESKTRCNLIWAQMPYAEEGGAK